MSTTNCGGWAAKRWKLCWTCMGDGGATVYSRNAVWTRLVVVGSSHMDLVEVGLEG